MEDIRIRMHAITECGYYSRGNSKSEFGDIGKMLGDLDCWIQGKNLNRTSTYQSDENNRIYSTYCYSIRVNSFGDYLITTWNGTSESSESIASVAGNEPVGKAKINLTGIPEGNIAGFATYFWILPRLNKLATIHFSDSKRRNGLPEFRKYLHNYMSLFSSYCIPDDQTSFANNLHALHETGEQTIKIIGYSDGSSKPQNLFPKFSTALHQKTSRNLEVIREKREDIRGVVRKIELSRDNEYQAGFVEKACSWIGLTKIENDRRHFRFKYRISLNNPSKEELEKIILSWKSDSGSSWDNLGFHLDGEAKVRWIDSFLASETFSFEIKRINAELVDIDSLLNTISNNRDTILDALGLDISKQGTNTELNSHETQQIPKNKAVLLSSD